jgi:hypothetical protein
VSVDENELAATATTDSHGRYNFDVLDGLRTGAYQVIVVDDDERQIASSEEVSITAGNQFINRVNVAVPPA